MHAFSFIIIFFKFFNVYTFLFVTGDITQKGYEKKKTRLLAPYVPKQQPQGLFC